MMCSISFAKSTSHDTLPSVALCQGELIGGSVREERHDILQANMHAAGLLDSQSAESAHDLDWYLELRRFGSVPHGGWGMGFERLVQHLTGLDNIRDAVPVPRYPGYCRF
jgi:asparaginyl-tRNA synthetase